MTITQANLFTTEAERMPFSVSLHGMRGIAAVVVLCGHIVERVYSPWGDDVPHIDVFNGSAAVTFFYTLSGLVLGASLARKNEGLSGLIPYFTRRLFRLMPLMFVSVSVCGLYLLFVEPHVPSPWVPESYGTLTVGKFLAGYIGYSLKPNPPIWSIFVELVASILLPFMVMTGRGPVYIIVCGIALLGFGSFNLGMHHHWNFYMIDFFLGLTILWWGRAFADFMVRLDKRVFWCSLAALFGVFYLRGKIWHRVFGDPSFNLVEVAAITPLIAVAFFKPERFVWIETKAFRFLGDISFSLYLTHTLLIALAFNALVMPFPSIVQYPLALSIGMIVIMLPICVYVAHLSFRFIETPGIRLGKWASSALEVSEDLASLPRSQPLTSE